MRWGGGGTVSDQRGPNIAGTNGPGGPLIAGDHKFRDMTNGQYCTGYCMYLYSTRTITLHEGNVAHLEQAYIRNVNVRCDGQTDR